MGLINLNRRLASCEESVEEDALEIAAEEEFFLPKRDDDFRVVALYGDVEEKKVAQTVGTLLTLEYTGVQERIILTDEQKELLKKAEEDGEELELSDEDIETEEIASPIELVISTRGGSALEMLALYDVMKRVQKTCPVHTTGVGKVMSAGVPLLAAGTKGQRRIGENCRVMIHGVSGGSIGQMHILENEVNEIKYMQEQYVKILQENTNMSEETIWNMINSKINYYLNAEEAVEHGIADIII